MASISRSSVLTVVVIAVLLAALPSAIWRIIQTGNLYLFTQDFFADLLARLSGPGRMRFVLQPTVAIILGARGGVKDARAGLPPFIRAVVFAWRPPAETVAKYVRIHSQPGSDSHSCRCRIAISHLSRNPPRGGVVARSRPHHDPLCFVSGIYE